MHRSETSQAVTVPPDWRPGTGVNDRRVRRLGTAAQRASLRRLATAASTASPAIVPITSRFAQKGSIISARLAKPRQTETEAYR